MRTRLAILMLAMLTACGSSMSPDGGTPTSCSGPPFGLFKASTCDGGTTSASATFYSDGGASVTWVDTGACNVDRVSCELLLTCTDAYQSVISLDWSPAEERLTGSWQRNGGGDVLCMTLQKQ